MPPFTDPKGRCRCINSDFAKVAALGPSLAVCFDGNCAPHGDAYFTQAFLTAQSDVGGNCLNQCGGVTQLCIANPGASCSQNAEFIQSQCGKPDTDNGSIPDDPSQPDPKPDVPDVPDEPTAPDPGDPDDPSGTLTTLVARFASLSKSAQAAVIFALVAALVVPFILITRAR